MNKYGGYQFNKFAYNHYEELRFIFNSRVSQLYPHYQYLDSDQKLVFLFKIENEQLITWVGKFVYNSFCLREEYHGKRG